ncbi:helix-turn-helix domain-containing protein [Streptomyces sp. NPDC006649]|uniref:helix-turn-helix domain-containing protein n=1 Tax=unclassified Streptomyces TaxID=2593676 RepID=UPI002E1B622F|nr:helix-turn-helix domain-containing protein [Streptomyces sp. NBC_00963]
MEATETTESAEGAQPGGLNARSGRYVRVRWIAEYFDVSLSTIYQAIEAGELPAVAIGLGNKKTLRVHQDDFEAFEVNCRVPLRSGKAHSPAVLGRGERRELAL